MGMKWRFGLLAAIAAAVVGGLMPHGVLAATQGSATEMVQLAEAPVLSMPLNCMDATCGKGTPASGTPAPAVALAAVLGGLAIAAVAASSIRRRRALVVALPEGTRDPLFHPPQFS
jgi:hypothetical protein